jgi:MinD-like ATPase involved in chromosome partitioning or flagellar assembly
MTVIDLSDFPVAIDAEPVITTSHAEVISIWGPAASGKTMLASNLAFELAAQKLRVLLIDLDSRRPSLAALMGLVDAGPGITALTRLARQGRLDEGEMTRLSAEIKFGNNRLDVITGMNANLRWPELDEAGLSGLMEVAKRSYDFVILDLNDELEEGLVSTRSDSDRNFATRWSLQICDRILAVFATDPVGINRFLFDVREFEHEYWALGNFVSQATVGKNPIRQIRDVLYQVGRIDPKALLPEDRSAVQWQVATGKPLLLSPKSSKLSNAIHTLALDLLDARARPLNSTA